MTSPRPSPLLAAARSLATDAVTAEVVGAWRAAGVSAVLLKGPTTAAWLYGDDRVRSYGDSDLLVSPTDVDVARNRLRALGFEAPDYDGPPPSPHAVPWSRRSDGAHVDLHHALFGAAAPPARQWAILTDGYTEAMSVGGTQVTVLTRPARALVIALHAGQHGASHEKPLEDLRRALAVASLDDWIGAAHLAQALGAVPMLAEGLALHTAGAELARRLPYARSWLAGGGRGTAAVTVERVAAARGVRARTRAIGDALFPSPDLMRSRSRLARRGRGGLALAYLLRLPGLARRAVPGVLSWYRAHRG